MLSGALDVDTHAASYALRLLLTHLSYPLGRSTDYEATGGKLASFGHESPGGYYRAFAYLCSVEDRCAHPDKATVTDLAPMHHSPMAYDTSLAHYCWVPRVRVQHAAVLDVSARPYSDRLRVPP